MIFLCFSSANSLSLRLKLIVCVRKWHFPMFILAKVGDKYEDLPSSFSKQNIWPKDDKQEMMLKGKYAFCHIQLSQLTRVPGLRTLFPSLFRLSGARNISGSGPAVLLG